MHPALRPGDRLLFDRFAYRASHPQVGDVVLARHPARRGVRFIKRVAEVRDDGCWLLGDNVEASTDSREIGAFRRDDILARAWILYWPRERWRRFGRGAGRG